MITPSAVSHYPGLFIHHTPTTLSCFINCICVVCQVAGFCIQFCTCFVLHCWPFCLLKDPFSLHLDPDLVLSTASRDRIKQANMVQQGGSSHPPGRPEHGGLCQGLHWRSSSVGDGEDLPHGLLLGRPGRALQIQDAVLDPRRVAGGLYQPGSTFERLSLQGGGSCRVRSR